MVLVILCQLAQCINNMSLEFLAALAKGTNEGLGDVDRVLTVQCEMLECPCSVCPTFLTALT